MKGIPFIRFLYFAGILGIVAGISLSKPAVSVGIICCSIAWLSELNFKSRLKRLVRHPLFIIAFSLLLFHLISFLWSDNLAYGLKDLKTKLPILVLPLIFCSSDQFELKAEWNYIRFVFIYSLVACTLLSFAIYFHWIKPNQFNAEDMRTMLFGVSGVRLAMFLCFALCILIHELFTLKSLLQRVFSALIAIWFVLFLNFIGSGTALYLFAILIPVCLLFFIFSLKKMVWKISALVISTIVVSMLVIPIWRTINQASLIHADPVTAPVTKFGEPYIDIPDYNFLESGYVVGANVAIRELEIAWNKRSSITFHKRDKKNQWIGSTLIRYLNSMGSAKDRLAVERLSAEDVSNIENGIANKQLLSKRGWEKRIHEIVFEIMAYRAGLNPLSNSITQRFFYWETGWNLWRENLFIGIGTGDLKDAYDKVYDALPYIVDEKFRLRTHNQYLTMAVTMGIPGLLLLLFYVVTIFITKGYKEQPLLAISFLIIMAASFFSEDTLETQSGVTFIAFFQTLFNTSSVVRKT